MVPGCAACKTVVERHVEDHRHQQRADKITKAAGQQQQRPGLRQIDERDDREQRPKAADVPRKTARKIGFRIQTLIDCIAAMPVAGGNLPNAVIAELEKVKNSPAIKAEPKRGDQA